MSRRGGKTHVLAWLDALCVADVSTAAKAHGMAAATTPRLPRRHRDARRPRDIGAREINASQATAKRARKELERAGLILWDGKQHGTKYPRRYTLILPKQGSPMTRAPGGSRNGAGVKWICRRLRTRRGWVRWSGCRCSVRFAVRLSGRRRDRGT